MLGAGITRTATVEPTVMATEGPTATRMETGGPIATGMGAPTATGTGAGTGTGAPSMPLSTRTKCGRSMVPTTAEKPTATEVEGTTEGTVGTTVTEVVGKTFLTARTERATRECYLASPMSPRCQPHAPSTARRVKSSRRCILGRPPRWTKTETTTPSPRATRTLARLASPTSSEFRRPNTRDHITLCPMRPRRATSTCHTPTIPPTGKSQLTPNLPTCWKK
mmetsp:Transcript_51129/g.120026  ORF Transcript_51129/g.120026 Transcript_51129/m.120026 type:complete len:222 (+) Transcript_51129:849-1514(+)